MPTMTGRHTITPAPLTPQQRSPELRRFRAWTLAQRIPLGVRDAAFLTLLQHIDPTALHDGPPIKQYVDGEIAFAAVIAALAKARDEILLETYILRDDRVGANVLDALVAAAARGVRVSVLADAVGSANTKDAFWHTLEQGGVTVRHFHRVWRRPLEALRRDHRKIIVIDRHIAFTGGMNIGEEYGSSVRTEQHAFRDTLIRAEGTVAGELAAVFAEGWDRAQGPPLPKLEYVSWAAPTPAPWPRRERMLSARALQARLERSLARRRDRRRGRFVKRELIVNRERERTMIVLDPRPGRGQREMVATLSALLGGTRERLWITTPYFAPPSRAIRLLIAAAQRGIDVRLMLPGPRADMPLIRHAAHATYRRLLAAGVRIFEYEPATLHAKTIVIDGYASVVGSSNLDFRSLWLNAECNLLIFDDGYAAQLEAAFVDDIACSDEITRARWAERTWAHRLLDRFARGLRSAM